MTLQGIIIKTTVSDSEYTPDMLTLIHRGISV